MRLNTPGGAATRRSPRALVPTLVPTASGRATAALLVPALILILTLTASPALAQFFAPGPLARPHTAFEGLDNCGKCHEQEKNHSPGRCLACHTELVPEIDKRAGLHGRMTAEARDQCQRCHPDHRGRDFQIVDWQGERTKFQHARTGYVLEGKHAQLTCESCHERSKVLVPDIARLLAAQPRRTTYLGLSPRCDSCHFDEHRGEVSTKCQSCHGQVTWRPAPTFNHQSTVFALRGKHKGLACAKCHPTVVEDEPPARAFPRPRASTFMQMSSIDHATCASCHDDPHDGKLGPQCASCHSENGWHLVSPAGGIDRVFHKRTQFPLVGAHASVPCRSCHGPFLGSAAVYKGIASARCDDCHQDAHVGQLVVRGKTRTDCVACHDANAFVPARYEFEQHAQTRFPLDGAHRATACRGCHPLDPFLKSLVPAQVRSNLRQQRRPLLISEAVLRPKRSPKQCTDCHQDLHQGQFAARIRENDCRTCHTTASFIDVKFDHEFDSRFPLTGAHLKTACASCHPTEAIRPRSPPTVRYTPIVTTCGGCHADPHQGQFVWNASRAAAATATAANTILNVSSDGSGNTARAADHAADRADINGGPAPIRRRGAQDCGFCHQTSDFRETLFSHGDARFTTFALKGKHAQLKCEACHRPVEVASNLTAVRYRPLPRTCVECHVDFHKGDFRGFEP